MPQNTAHGWPYVLPADNIADYPVTSQALATKLEAGTALPFGCSMYLPTGTNMTSGVNTVLPISTVTFDSASMASAGRITVKQAGYYLAAAGIQFAANASGVRGILARLNGGSVYPVRVSYFPIAAGAHYIEGVGNVRQYAVNDYLELLGVQTSGATLQAGPGQDETWLSLIRVG